MSEEQAKRRRPKADPLTEALKRFGQVESPPPSGESMHPTAKGIEMLAESQAEKFARLVADGTTRYAPDLNKTRLEEALTHLSNMLNLIRGFNGNHEYIEDWCRLCDGNYLHTTESCPCVCHPARGFLAMAKAELAGPKL